jgi:soluble lytic murein transglycosylase
MQLMPRTGRMTAAHIKTRVRSTSDLLDVRQNIRLGAAYLKQMLNRYNGHSTLATASYNAGPHRVTQWMPDKSMPADLWVEMIPFSETRNYVRKVMAYTVIYDYRLNGEASQIRQRMPTVTPGKRS